MVSLDHACLACSIPDAWVGLDAAVVKVHMGMDKALNNQDEGVGNKDASHVRQQLQTAGRLRDVTKDDVGDEEVMQRDDVDVQVVVQSA